MQTTTNTNSEQFKSVYIYLLRYGAPVFLLASWSQESAITWWILGRLLGSGSSSFFRRQMAAEKREKSKCVLLFFLHAHQHVKQEQLSRCWNMLRQVLESCCVIIVFIPRPQTLLSSSTSLRFKILLNYQRCKVKLLMQQQNRWNW